MLKGCCNPRAMTVTLKLVLLRRVEGVGPWPQVNHANSGPRRLRGLREQCRSKRCRQQGEKPYGFPHKNLIILDLD